MLRAAVRLLLIFAASVASAHAAQDCGFLPTSEVNQAFAEFAPWRTEVGGAVGQCLFLSNEQAPPNFLSFVQQFKTSKADADSVYNGMRQGFAESYVITNVANFGDRAFRYSKKGDDPSGQRLIFIVAQKDKLVVTINLMLQRNVTDADISAVMKLGQSALRGANDPKTIRAASTCPWFNESGLKKLFSGKPYEVQVHGENSCMAVDKKKNVLLVSAIKISRELSLDALREQDCQYRDLPEIEKDAKLSFTCKGGNPRATVDFMANGVMLKLTWVPLNREPGEAEKNALVEVAKYARSVEMAR